MAVRPPDGRADRQAELHDLFRAHATPLLRLAMVLTGDRSAAEDLVQEAFVRYHRQARPPALGAELAYLRRTVVNLSHGHHRRLRVVRSHRADPPGVGAAAEHDAVRRDAQQRVADAVRALPARQRDCTVLRFYAGLTDTEIADALDISPGSVKTHLHRARATLADLLEALR
ncbi:MAG: sigma-70 family RNA polymerase sigma factor [Acidimicrobiales bacterium]